MSFASTISDMQCWHYCPQCKGDHCHIVITVDAKLDTYRKVCNRCKQARRKVTQRLKLRSNFFVKAEAPKGAADESSHQV